MTRPRITARAARWSASHPWKALGLWLLFVGVGVVLSGLVTTQEATGRDAGTGPSGRAATLLHEAGMTPPADEQILLTSPDGPPDEAEVEATAADLTARLGELPEVDGVGDLVWSESGDAALLPVTLSGDPDDLGDDVVPVREVTAQVARDHPDLGVEQTGSASIDDAIMGVVEEDLASATSLSLPVTLVIMLLAFGALIAAAIPVLLALSAVVTSFGLYALASYVVPDMGTVANMIMLIGMAVGIDYSLFFVKRQREERARGHNPVDAVEIAAQTAGHSIVVSGLAVIVSVSALFLVGNVIFSGLAAGAILVVAVAMLGSLTVVPALVGKLGRWVDRPRVPLLWRLQRQAGTGALSGRVVATVLRRPRAALAASVGVTLVLAAPVVGLRLQDASLDQLPDGLDAVDTLNHLRAEFPSEGTATSIVVQAPEDADASEVRAALQDLSEVAVASHDFAPEGAALTESADGRTFELELRSVHPRGSSESIDALEELRSDLAPAALAPLDGAEWATAGGEAESVDFADQQASALPWVVAFVLVFTLVTMAVTFRSLGVVAITLVLNLASLAASFGVLVGVFQNRWAESLLGFTSNGTVVSWIPLFMFVVLVGLSMDYHVLALNRIREGACRGASPLTAISWGMRQTAGTIVMAALVMVSVFGLFAMSSLVEMKQMGFGLAIAVLIDATLVRIIMLPAALALCGKVVETMARRAPSGLGEPHEAPTSGSAPHPEEPTGVLAPQTAP